MSRFSKTGLIVFAVVGVLAFFSPIDNSQVFGAAGGVPGAPTTSVTVTNTPLPVNVTNFGSTEPPREAFGIQLASVTANPALTIDASVTLLKPAVIETIAARCGGPSYISLVLSTVQQNAQVTGNGAYIDIPQYDYAAQILFNPFIAYLPLTQVNAPTGVRFDLIAVSIASNTPTHCYVTIVVRYTP